jgi:hypothetical protein
VRDAEDKWISGCAVPLRLPVIILAWSSVILIVFNAHLHVCDHFYIGNPLVQPFGVTSAQGTTYHRSVQPVRTAGRGRFCCEALIWMFQMVQDISIESQIPLTLREKEYVSIAKTSRTAHASLLRGISMSSTMHNQASLQRTGNEGTYFGCHDYGGWRLLGGLGF